MRWHLDCHRQRRRSNGSRSAPEGRVITRPPDGHAVVRLTIDGTAWDACQDERLVDVITRIGGTVPHVCYHPQLGAIQTCDTCMVEVNGQLARACATGAVDGMVVNT